MPIEYWILFVVSFLAAFLFTPLLRKLAVFLDIQDYPTERKIHRQPIPYLGGIAFHISMSLCFIYMIYFVPYVLHIQDTIQLFFTLYGAAVCFQLLGIFDDITPISPFWKLLIQIVLAAFLVNSHFFISQISSPFGGTIPLGWFGWIFSVLWILTIVNAINFIDGMDGLAAGVVFFAALANLLIALHPWQNFVCIISLILLGMTLGFLPYNFSPARIFMGDAGSLYLGVLLGGSALASNVKGATVLSLSLPLVILSIPLLDTFLTVMRRGKKGKNFFKADREHIHHRLLRMGFTDKQVVLSVYGLSFLLAMSAILAAQLPTRYTVLFIIVFLAAIIWGVLIFAAFERRILSRQEFTPIAGSEDTQQSPRQ